MEKFTKDIIDKLNIQDDKVEENTFSFDAKILDILDDIAKLKEFKNNDKEITKKIIYNIPILIESDIQYVLSEIIISLENVLSEEEKENIISEIIKYYIEIVKVERDEIKKKKQLEKIYEKIIKNGNIKRNRKISKERKIKIVEKDEKQILNEFKEIISETENRNNKNKNKKIRLEDIRKDIKRRQDKIKKEKYELNEEIKKEKIYNLSTKYSLIRVLNTLKNEDDKLEKYIKLIENDVITLNTKLDITLLNLKDEYIIKYLKNIIKLNKENIKYTYDILSYVNDENIKIKMLLEIIEENTKESLIILNNCKLDTIFYNSKVKLDDITILKIIELTPKIQSINEKRLLYILYSLLSEKDVQKYGKELFESYVVEDINTYVSRYNAIKKDEEFKKIENIIYKKDIHFDITMQVSGGLPVSMIKYLKKHIFKLYNYNNFNINNNDEIVNENDTADLKEEVNRKIEDRIKIIEDKSTVNGKKIIIKNISTSNNDIEMLDNILAFLRYNKSNILYDSLLKIDISTKYIDDPSIYENLINEWKLNKNIISKMLYYNNEHESKEVREYNKKGFDIIEERNKLYNIKDEYDLYKLQNKIIRDNKYNKEKINFLNILNKENKKSITFNIYNYSLEYDKFMYNLIYYIKIFETAILVEEDDIVTKKFSQMLKEESDIERAKILLDIMFQNEKAISILMLNNDNNNFKMRYYNNYISNSKNTKFEKEYLSNFKNIEKNYSDINTTNTSICTSVNNIKDHKYFDKNDYRSINEKLRNIKKVLIAKK